MKPTDDCCKIWPRLWWAFYWLTDESGTLLVMPYLQAPNEGDKWRVNYCPSCGADVRDCVIERKRFADEVF